ncbi:MAG: hypothetical protein R3C05_23920 [Pirellulaceae bacterium]
MLRWLLHRRAAGESVVFSEVCVEHRDKAEPWKIRCTKNLLS